MRLLIILLMFSNLAFSQFSGTAISINGAGSNNSYTVDITNFNSQRNDNLPNEIQAGFFLVDVNFNRYEIDDIDSPTFSSATLTVTALDDDVAPTGLTLVYETIYCDLIPLEPDNTLGLSQKMESQIHTYNLTRIEFCNRSDLQAFFNVTANEFEVTEFVLPDPSTTNVNQVLRVERNGADNYYPSDYTIDKVNNKIIPTLPYVGETLIVRL